MEKALKGRNNIAWGLAPTEIHSSPAPRSVSPQARRSGVNFGERGKS